MEQANTERDLTCDITQTEDSESNSPFSEAQTTSLPEENVEEHQEGISFSEDLEGLSPETENNSEPSFKLEQLNGTVEELPQYNVPSNGIEGRDGMLTSSSLKGLSSGTLAAPFDGPQVKFLDSIVLTSYSPLKPREETAADTPKSILKTTRDENKPKPNPEVNKPAAFTPEQQTLPEKETRPSVERRDADIKKQRKPNPQLELLESKLSEKKVEPEKLISEVKPSEQNESLISERFVALIVI